MPGLGKRTAVLTLSRLANYGLMLVSPVILARLLSVADFGRYREFLLYASLLQAFASLAINDSLLYFVPRYADSAWRVVRQTTLLVASTSIPVVAAVVMADLVSGAALLGGFRVQLAVYVLFFVNIDFWEDFLVARDEPLKMFAYSAGRLLARMLVVVAVAAATRDIQAIIWSLIGLETIRIAASALIWRLAAHERLEPSIRGVWREQLHFCIPAGLGVLLAMGNQSLGNIVVAKAIGAIALAHFTIGTYGEPIVGALRNSISMVLLPEMVRLGTDGSKEPMVLWEKSTVVNCMLLFPCAVLACHFAEPLIVTLFGPNYRPAVPVLQIYVLGVIRSCFDFSPPLRAINKTRPLLYSNVAALLANGACLWFFVPRYGLVGAMCAAIVSTYVNAVYLGTAVLGQYATTIRALLPWKSILKVAVAAAAAFLVIAPGFWVRYMGFFGVLLASALYMLIFVAILLASRIPEAWSLVHRARRFAVAATS